MKIRYKCWNTDMCVHSAQRHFCMDQHKIQIQIAEWHARSRLYLAAVQDLQSNRTVLSTPVAVRLMCSRHSEITPSIECLSATPARCYLLGRLTEQTWLSLDVFRLFFRLCWALVPHWLQGVRGESELAQNKAESLRTDCNFDANLLQTWLRI